MTVQLSTRCGPAVGPLWGDAPSISSTLSGQANHGIQLQTNQLESTSQSGVAEAACCQRHAAAASANAKDQKRDVRVKSTLTHKLIGKSAQALIVAGVWMV